MAYSSEPEDTIKQKTIKYLPAIYYTPETRIALEGFAFYSYYNGEDVRKSNIRVFAAYTQNRQFTVDLPWQIYTKDEKYFFNGKLQLQNFPEYFYGIGNNTSEEIRELYTYNAFRLSSQKLKKVSRNTFFGLEYRAEYLITELPFLSNASSQTPKEVIGNDGYFYLSVGPVFIYDSRDHLLNPSEGNFIEFSSLWSRKFNNYQNGFLQAKFDYRNYTKIGRTTILANQFLAHAGWGDIPYRALPTLGGPLLLRGYYFGRFRDNQLIAFQSEIRQHLFWRIGIVGFVGAGRVYENFNQNVLSNLHLAYGSGLRFRLSNDDRVNIRFDVGLTPDSKGVYVYFSEAF
jgi:outer membrane translocation and assembly module TamA